jgi:hypothetical protein
VHFFATDDSSVVGSQCQTSETVWAVEDGTLQLTIGKDTVGEKGWWKCFIKGDPVRCLILFFRPFPFNCKPTSAAFFTSIQLQTDNRSIFPLQTLSTQLPIKIFLLSNFGSHTPLPLLVLICHQLDHHSTTVTLWKPVSHTNLFILFGLAVHRLEADRPGEHESR